MGGVPGAPLSVPSLQMSLRQMSQTRFYVAESRALAPHVSLFVGGLPPGLSPQEYRSLLDEAVASKGAPAWTVTPWAGGVPGRVGGGPRPGVLRGVLGLQCQGGALLLPPPPSHMPDWLLTRGSLSSRLRLRACYLLWSVSGPPDLGPGAAQCLK